MGKLFSGYPSSKCRHLLERTISGVPQQAASRQCYYDETVDLNFIGPMCKAADISRDSFMQPPVLKSNPLTRGILLELGSCYEGSIFSTVNHIYPNMYQERTIKTELKKTKKLFTKLNKSKGRNDAATVFLGETINILAPEDQASTSQVPVHVTSSCRSSTTSNANKDKVKGKVKEKNKDSEKVNTLKEKESILLNLCKDKSREILELETAVCGLKKKLDETTLKLTKVENHARNLKEELKEKQKHITNLKSTAMYQKLRRKAQYLNKKEEHIRKVSSQQSEHEEKLQKKVKGLQRRLRVQKQKVARVTTQRTQCLSELKSVKNELITLQADYDLTVSNRIELRREGLGRPYIDDVEKCVMKLCCELDVPTTKVGDVIGTVCKLIFNKVDIDSLPSASTANNMVDRAHILSKLQVAEGIMESERWDLHGDGTSRDGKKILGQQVTLDSGQTLSGGFSSVAVEDGVTLLDNVILMMEELSDLFGAEEKEAVYKEMMRKMFAVMSDRSSVNKAFNNQLEMYRETLLGEESVGLHFLYCNAHFLLGLANNCEGVLKELEKELVKDIGHGLGRDAEAKFGRFSSSGESAAARYIRTACDVLGPRGDQKNGCRCKWEAFCSQTLGEKSEISSFRMNRFNNFFKGAAGLFFHKYQINQFFHDYNDSLNLKLESVMLDCQCTEIQSLIRALGIIYYVVTGPFWNLLQSDVHYLDQYKYIQEMLDKFEQWSHDSSALLTGTVSVFSDFAVPVDKLWNCLTSESLLESDLPKSALESTMAGFVKVVRKQLSDFLPEGMYGSAPEDDLRVKMKHCKLTNLVAEYEFGDLDFSQFRRRHASLHFHSGIQMVKKNKTISNWLSSKSPNDQSSLLELARSKSSALKQKHREAEREVVRKTEERLKEINRKKREKEALKLEIKRKLVESVKQHGGPCMKPYEVDNIVKNAAGQKQKVEFVKDEIRYLKNVVGIVDKRLVFGKKDLRTLVNDLKAVLKMSIETDDTSSSSTSNTVDEIHVDKDDEIDLVDLPAVGNKRKKSEVSAQCKKQKVISQGTTGGHNELTYSFHSQGEWVAVAYETEWFIGSVVKVISSEQAVVQFLSKGHQNVYRWPRIDDLDTIDRKFVFANGFDVNTANGRIWTVSEVDYLQELYENYSSLYFVDSLDVE
jgi:hypothetical protein